MTRSIVLWVSLLVAAPAAAQDALLWELSPGRTGATDAQYVVLEGAPGASLDGLTIVTEDAFGVALPVFARLDGERIGANGYLLVASLSADDFYGFEAPATAASASIVPEGGRVCLTSGETALDCVGYGSFAQAEYGLPAPAVGLDQALTRVNTTGQNSVDWIVASSVDPAQYLPAATDGGVADGGSDAGVDAGADAGGSGAIGGGAQGGGTVPEHEGPGCVCGAGGSASPLVLLLLAGLLARRRRPARGAR